MVLVWSSGESHPAQQLVGACYHRYLQRSGQSASTHKHPNTSCWCWQGNPSLLAVRRAEQDPHHSYLAFSSELLQSTLVMDVRQGSFSQVLLACIAVLAICDSKTSLSAPTSMSCTQTVLT